MKKISRERIMKPVFFAAMLLVFTGTFIACSKQQKPVANTTPPLEKMDQMKQFLSVTLGVTKEKVNYDQQKDEFFVEGTVFHESKESVKARYDNANEYKLNFEQKK